MKAPAALSLAAARARDLEVRLLSDTAVGDMLILHLHFDVRDAMGANLVNSAVERIAPLVEGICGGRVNLRILSNLSDRRLARASGAISRNALATNDATGFRGGPMDLRGGPPSPKPTPTGQPRTTRAS